MKRSLNILLMLIAIAAFHGAKAQEFSVISFKRLEMDLDARSTNTLKDQNGHKTAIIKVVTPDRDFDYDVGMMGIVDIRYEVGETWLYVPAGVQRITIRHSLWGVLRDYRFATAIDEATVYELRLKTPARPTDKSDTDNMIAAVADSAALASPDSVTIFHASTDNDAVPTSISKKTPDTSFGISAGYDAVRGAYRAGIDLRNGRNVFMVGISAASSRTSLEVYRSLDERYLGTVDYSALAFMAGYGHLTSITDRLRVVPAVSVGGAILTGNDSAVGEDIAWKDKSSLRLAVSAGLALRIGRSVELCAEPSYAILLLQSDICKKAAKRSRQLDRFFSGAGMAIGINITLWSK